MNVEDFKIISKEKNGRTYYYFKCDKDCLDAINEKFVLSVYPHQWWGNVLNPSVVVLAINPHYGVGEDELDSAVFEKLILNNYSLNNGHGQYLFDDSIGECNVPFKYSSVSRWWRNIFEDILPDVLSDNLNDKEKKEIHSFNGNVGFFNLVGYQSRNADNITKINCESEKRILAHVNELAKDKNRVFIYVWGKDKWDKAFAKNEMKCNIKNYIEVNKKDSINPKISTQNKKLNIKIKNDNDRNILKTILTSKDVNRKVVNDFLNKYGVKNEEQV